MYFTKWSPNISSTHLAPYTVITVLLTVFPGLYFTSPWLFSNYQFVLLNPRTCVLFPCSYFEILQELWKLSSCWIWVMSVLLALQSLIRTAVLCCFLCRRAHTILELWSAYCWRSQMKAQLSLMLWRERVSRKDKTLHTFLLYVKDLSKSITVYVFILFGHSHCYSWRCAAFSLWWNFLQVGFFHACLTPP